MTYFANVRSYRGTMWSQPIVGRNLVELQKQIVDLAKEQRAYGTAIEWFIWKENERTCKRHGLINAEGKNHVLANTEPVPINYNRQAL